MSRTLKRLLSLVLSACLLLLLLSLRLTPGSRVLEFLGRHALSVYLLQRLPMILFYETGLTDMVPHLTFFAVLAVTCLLAFLADSLMSKARLPGQKSPGGFRGSV